jgi:hypothetical protein
MLAILAVAVSQMGKSYQETISRFKVETRQTKRSGSGGF